MSFVYYETPLLCFSSGKMLLSMPKYRLFIAKAAGKHSLKENSDTWIEGQNRPLQSSFSTLCTNRPQNFIHCAVQERNQVLGLDDLNSNF